jgi:2-methylaconitate cis-trans-isomerase PrpF
MRLTGRAQSGVLPKGFAARALNCSVLRGGTSRGVFFSAEDLPTDRGTVEKILLNVIGSPDMRQVDGLGGGTSQTSKAAIVGPSNRANTDVEFTFAQLGIGQPVVDWGGNCGNLSSAVGPFAINRGMLKANGHQAAVRIHNTNTDKMIVAHVPLQSGRAAVGGDFAIPGVPGGGALIRLEFQDPAGSLTKRLLPTGRVRDIIELSDGRRLTASIVDAGNPVVFIRAEELGLKGFELPLEIEVADDVRTALEESRAIVAMWLGLVRNPREASRISPGLPKVGFVAPPADYITVTGQRVAAGEMDLLGRLMSMQTPHSSYMVTGAICAAAAACITGTVVHETVGHTLERPSGRVRIGHPSGVLEAQVAASGSRDQPNIESVTIDRTARHIIDGIVYVPEHLF